MPELTPLYVQKNRPMRVAIMMSGSGTNAVKIIEYAKKECVPPYTPAFIFSENPDSNAKGIGIRYGIPSVIRVIQKKGKESRKNFDGVICELFRDYNIDAVALAGYNWFVSPAIHDNFVTVNVHPADLRPLKEDGKRKYAGGIGHEPSMKAIAAGEKEVYSTTHIVTEVPDGGPILMVSDAVPVELPEGITLDELVKEESKEKFIAIAKEHQDRLKEFGDWKIFPKTLELIAQGRYAKDAQGNLYFDGRLIPNGIEYKEVM